MRRCAAGPAVAVPPNLIKETCVYRQGPSLCCLLQNICWSVIVLQKVSKLILTNTVLALYLSGTGFTKIQGHSKPLNKMHISPVQGGECRDSRLLHDTQRQCPAINKTSISSPRRLREHYHRGGKRMEELENRRMAVKCHAPLKALKWQPCMINAYKLVSVFTIIEEYSKHGIP